MGTKKADCEKWMGRYAAVVADAVGRACAGRKDALPEVWREDNTVTIMLGKADVAGYRVKDNRFRRMAIKRAVRLLPCMDGLRLNLQARYSCLREGPGEMLIRTDNTGKAIGSYRR